jgi:hypothetical protein
MPAVGANCGTLCEVLLAVSAFWSLIPGYQGNQDADRSQNQANQKAGDLAAALVAVQRGGDYAAQKPDADDADVFHFLFSYYLSD